MIEQLTKRVPAMRPGHIYEIHVDANEVGFEAAVPAGDALRWADPEDRQQWAEFIDDVEAKGLRCLLAVHESGALLVEVDR